MRTVRDEIAEEHLEIAHNKLESFLQVEFPITEYPRILVAGDAATQIADTAKNGFDLIIMPTHAGIFRRMLLGSTTAKVLDDADCPVSTSAHTDTITPRPLEHREWLCAIGVGEDAERVLRYAHRASVEHAVTCIIRNFRPPIADCIQLDLRNKSSLRKCSKRASASTSCRRVGSRAPVRIAVSRSKRRCWRLLSNRTPTRWSWEEFPTYGTQGHLRDLTYAMVRDSPFPFSI